MQLSDLIIQRIHHEGPVSFHDFMEMCLYHPELGYYTSAGDKIGVNGDFYTTPAITSVLGAVIGRQLEEMWDIAGRNEFTIVEYGAGTGMLCRDILGHLQNNGQFYHKLRYCIIEKSAAMRLTQQKHLPAKVQWIDSIYDIAPFTGCVFSNELVDNFSIHKVVMRDELMEVFVDYQNEFVELLKPAAGELTNYLDELDIILPKDFQAEINLEATEWMRQIAECLEKGFVMTIDYGYTSSELYSDRRSNGTLLCYHKHTINDQPYINIGAQDITAHVNFSALSHWGSKYGLSSCGLISQAAFLVALGYEDHLSRLLSQQKDKYKAFKQYAFLKHTLLLDMGQKFKVLIQNKGVSHSALRCFEMDKRAKHVPMG